MVKAERPGEEQANIFHDASYSSKLPLCLISQNRVTWSLTAAREAGTVSCLCCRGWTHCHHKHNPGLVSRKEGQLLGKHLASPWFRCSCLSALPVPHTPLFTQLCLPTVTSWFSHYFPGVGWLSVSFISPCHAAAHSIQFFPLLHLAHNWSAIDVRCLPL